MKSWFKLDNAATIFPSVISEKDPNVFRISVTLKEIVYYDALKEALNKAIKKFHYFQVFLKKGFFWYYFERTDRLPFPEPEFCYPCRDLKIRKNRFLFRIIPYKNRISIETTHALTDGFGALVFLKAIVIEYLNIMHGPFDNYENEIYNFNIDNEDEFLDPFKRFKNITKRKPEKKDRGWKLPFKVVKPFFYYITQILLDTKEVKNVAKSFKGTINDFLVTNFIYSFQQIYRSLPPKYRKHDKYKIRAVVPVNLRQFYKSDSFKNFAFIVSPAIDPALGEYSFEEIFKIVHHFIRLHANNKDFLPELTRNVNSQYNPIVRGMPLLIKDFVLKIAYGIFADKPFTSSMSNLGSVKIDERMKKYIKNFDFIPAPAIGTKIGAGVIGFENILSINFGRIYHSTIYERVFIDNLKKFGLNIEINTNYEYS